MIDKFFELFWILKKFWKIWYYLKAMAEWIIKEKNALEKRRVKVEKTGKK